MFVIQLLFNNGSEVILMQPTIQLSLCIPRDNPVYNKKFEAHSHLPDNGLYSICSLMVLMVPRSHTLLRLQNRQVPAYLNQTTFFGFAQAMMQYTQ